VISPHPFFFFISRSARSAHFLFFSRPLIVSLSGFVHGMLFVARRTVVAPPLPRLPLSPDPRRSLCRLSVPSAPSFPPHGAFPKPASALYGRILTFPSERYGQLDYILPTEIGFPLFSRFPSARSRALHSTSHGPPHSYLLTIGPFPQDFQI